MGLTEENIRAIISRHLPDFEFRGPLQPLEGGNLNYVWCVEGLQRNIIVKYAPPYIVSNPVVPLSPDRIHFEAKGLQLFQKGGALHPLNSRQMRPPSIEFYDEQNHLLAMEDLGDLPHIAQINQNEVNYSNLGIVLGSFIAQLHKKTYQNEDLAKQFNNSDIQETRFEVQYRAAADYAEKGGAREIDAIKKRTETLGKRMLEPGVCLIMGDLWPPSILIDSDTIRLIDWEFCHFGQPLQDVGHFAAHCWMQAQTESQEKKESFKRLWLSFWKAYKQELGEWFSRLMDERELKDAATHAGAEILIRAVGPFKNGYVYESHESDAPLVHKAVQKAQHLILTDDLSTFSI